MLTGRSKNARGQVIRSDSQTKSRERTVLALRFGLPMGRRQTQKEIAKPAFPVPMFHVSKEGYCQNS